MLVPLIIIQIEVSASVRLEIDIQGIAELVIDLIGQDLIALCISCIVIAIDLHEVEPSHV